MKKTTLDKFKIHDFEPLRFDRKVKTYIIRGGQYRSKITIRKLLAYFPFVRKRMVSFYKKSKLKKNRHKVIYSFITVIGFIIISSFIVVASHSADQSRLLQQKEKEKATAIEQLSGAHTQLKLVKKAVTHTKTELKQKKDTEALLKAKIKKIDAKYKQLLQTKAHEKLILASARTAQSVGYIAPIKNSYKPIKQYASSLGNTYTYGYCTWFAKQMRPDIPNGWGNANQWVSHAQLAHWPTGYKPKVGAVGAQGNHVVYITGVSGSNVTLSEANYVGWNIQSSRTAPASDFVYIY